MCMETAVVSGAWRLEAWGCALPCSSLETSKARACVSAGLHSGGTPTAGVDRPESFIRLGFL